MLGSVDKEKDKKLAALRVTQALATQQKADFMRQPTRVGTRRRSNLPGKRVPYPTKKKEIAPPKTIGDIVRYNREMKAKQIADAQSNTEAKQRTADFNATQQAGHLNRADNISQQRADITGKHYETSDADAAIRTSSMIENASARTGIMKDTAKSTAALRGVQQRGLEQQNEITEEAGPLRRSTQALQAEITAERLKQANSKAPDYTRLQALEGRLSAPLSEKDQANLTQKDMSNYVKFKATLPMNTTDEEAMSQFKKMKRLNQNALYTDPDNQLEEETDDEYLNRLFNS